jgi:predicted hydrocarbon binding protein
MAADEKMTTNMAIRTTIETVTEIMGSNGARIIFRNAGAENLFDNPPPYDFNPCVPTTIQTQIFIEVGELVGLKGALSIWRRMGYSNVKFGNEIGHIFDGYKDLPPDEKFNKCIELLSMTIGKGTTIIGADGKAEFNGSDCTLCSPYYNQGVERPVCTAYTGIFQYVADLVYGKDVMVMIETKCKAKGDDTCYYKLEKRD